MNSSLPRANAWAPNRSMVLDHRCERGSAGWLRIAELATDVRLYEGAVDEVLRAS